MNADGDQLPDPWEVNNLIKANDSTDDPDEDILHNLAEFQNGSDPNDPDTDDDGLLDGWEINLTKQALKPDSNNNDVSDFMEDTDADGLQMDGVNSWIRCDSQGACVHSVNALETAIK